MKKPLFSCIFLFMSFALSAQHEADNWYFGYNAGISFSSGSPVALTNGALASDEGFSSISDSNGNLLFYTNGVKVWDRNHQLMPNGTGLFGNTSSTQCLIVKRPGSSERYYIFTLDIVYSDFPDDGFNYSEVNMSLNGGFGDVIPLVKNINLIPDSVSEKISGVKHSNGIDIWVLVHRWNSNEFYAYLVTSTGMVTPIINNTGAIQTGFDSQGQMKFNLSGSRVGLAAQESGYFEIFDFDKTNGIVSNPLLFMDSNTQGAYGLEFSPDGEKLYVSSGINNLNDSVYQYNLLAGSDSLILASKISLGSINVNDHVGQLQLGPDGKIYIVKVSQLKLAVINNPNSLGLSCNLAPNGFQLVAPGLNGIGLPNFVVDNLLPTDINEILNENLFEFYYDAFSNSIDITVPDSRVNTFTLKLFDILGKKQILENFIIENHFLKLPLPDLKQGIYFINVSSKNLNQTKKIIITN